MKRWRTVALIGVETEDGRRIDSVSLRGPAVTVTVVSRAVRRRKPWGHEGAVARGAADVRVQDREVQARLPWRWRHATPSFDQMEVDLPGLALLAMAGVGCTWAAVRGARRHEHRTGE